MYPQRPFGRPRSCEDTCLEEQAQDRKSKQQGNHLIAPSSSNAYRQNVRESCSVDQALCRSTVVISWSNLGQYCRLLQSIYWSSGRTISLISFVISNRQASCKLKMS